MLFSLLGGAYIIFVLQIPGFTILDHSFRPNPAVLLLAVILALPALLGLWHILSKTATNRFSLSRGEALHGFFPSFLPLLFLSLAPLTLSHYVGAKDLLSRVNLLGWAVLSAFIYLLTVRLLEWLRERQPALPRKKFLELFYGLPLKKKLLLLFAASLILYNLGALVMLSEGIMFSGDEPHYLLITHSLLYDGDIDLADNYARRDYEQYMIPGVTIQPHTVAGAQPESRLSFHSPGISFLLLPFYALGSLFGAAPLSLLIRFGMSLIGGLFGLQVFLFALKEWTKEGTALLLWFLVSFTSPVYFYSIHVYPELIGGLLSFLVFRFLRSAAELTAGKMVLLGLFLSSFIWFHALKYLFILIPLGAYCFWTILRTPSLRQRVAFFLLPFLAVSSAYFYFQYTQYGSLSLSAISWQGKMTGGESLDFLKTILDVPLRFRLETLAGYFLDQKDGLLFYAPLYFFALLGAWLMFRKKRPEFLLLALLTTPYFLNSAFLTQRTGYAPQARPLVSTFWGMGIFLGYFIAENRKKTFGYLFKAAAAASLGVVLLLLFNPFNLYQETTAGIIERGGGLFYLLSNLHFSLPSLLPSFLKVEEWRWLPNFIWVGALLLFVVAYALAKERDFSLKFRTHLGLACAGLSVFFFWQVLYPRMVLLRPLNVAFTAREKVTLYGLGRVARMSEPGKFVLPQDDRPYHFLFTSRRMIEDVRLEFGSPHGDYPCELKLFDHSVFKGRTEKEIKSLDRPSPPYYKLKKAYFYWVTINLGKGEGVRTSQNPYLFRIAPVFARPDVP